jgi:hypothetical protein
MFVIVHDNTVILGPMRWSQYKFQNTILEECEVSATLSATNDNLDPITVSDTIKILPVQGTQTPQVNPVIEMLNGPFWEFTDSVAAMSYRVESMSLDAAKNFLKVRVASDRRKKENAGIKVTLNSIEYNFDTDRETRAVLSGAAANTNNTNWKQNSDTWVQMTQAEVQTVLNDVLAHVQTCFDWEYTKLQDINNCTTLDQVAGISTQLDSIE